MLYYLVRHNLQLSSFSSSVDRTRKTRLSILSLTWHYIWNCIFLYFPIHPFLILFIADLAASFNFCLETTNSLLPKGVFTLEIKFLESILILEVAFPKESFARLTLALDIILVIVFYILINMLQIYKLNFYSQNIWRLISILCNLSWRGGAVILKKHRKQNAKYKGVSGENEPAGRPIRRSIVRIMINNRFCAIIAEYRA